MTDFLLIHGSCHGAWCWRDLIPALTKLGHTARAIDLPGAGEDLTPLASISLDDCRDAVLAATTPDTVIMGHSWGGYPISAATEADPTAMRGLIYLCAYVPKSGHSMVDMRKGARRQLIMEAVQRDDSGEAYSIDPTRVPELFYHDCSPEVQAYAAAHLRPQPITPQVTPLTVTDRFATVPKAYIRGAQDHTIDPDYQVEMTKDWPTDTVMTMDTSHSPFFADPIGLAKNMDTLSKQF